MNDDIIKRLREVIAKPALHDENASSDDTWQAVRKFRQLASPDNIAALLDRLDAAEAENARLRAVVSALAFQASRDPFVSVGHWCEHGPCAAIIRDISNPNADHHGPDWTERDSEYLK